MARSSTGWVKDWRLPEDHWLREDLITEAFFKMLVRWANHMDSPPKSTVVLKRGQLVTSLHELAEIKIGYRQKLGIQRVRTLLARGARYGFLNTLTNTRGTIITICNYRKYQDKDETNQHTGQQTANKRETNEKQLNKNIKKKKNLKKGEESPPIEEADVNAVVEKFASAYLAAHSAALLPTEGRRKQAAELIQTHGKEKVLKLVAFYPYTEKKFFQGQSDFGLLLDEARFAEMFEEMTRRISKRRKQATYGLTEDEIEQRKRYFERSSS